MQDLDSGFKVPKKVDKGPRKMVIANPLEALSQPETLNLLRLA